MSPAYQLRPSRVLQKLRQGDVATCVKINLADPRVAEIAGMAGFDCVWLDLEHVPNTMQDIEQSVRAAKAYDCDAMVRVQRGSYSDMVRPLEMDGTGILVPHVFTGAEAGQIAHQTRFHPIGRRALDSGNADGAYCTVPLENYLEHANHQRFVIVQIEDPEAMDELDAIAATPGIDMLFFGPADFSHGLGIPGKFDDPRIDAARREVAQAALRHGKFAATTTSSNGISAMVDMGYRFINVGADVIALTQTFSEILAAFGRQPAPSRSIYSEKA